MSYRVEFTNAAMKGIVRIPKKQRLILMSWISDNLDGCDNPRAVPGGKQIRGSDRGWRWRVGSYRILGRIEDDVLSIKVVRAGHRQGVYDNMPKL